MIWGQGQNLKAEARVSRGRGQELKAEAKFLAQGLCGLEALTSLQRNLWHFCSRTVSF